MKIANGEKKYFNKEEEQRLTVEKKKSRTI